MSKDKNEKKDKFRFRIDILLFVVIIILIVTFCAYMMNTKLENVLLDERGESIITHDYTYDDSSK